MDWRPKRESDHEPPPNPDFRGLPTRTRRVRWLPENSIPRGTPEERQHSRAPARVNPILLAAFLVRLRAHEQILRNQRPSKRTAVTGNRADRTRKHRGRFLLRFGSRSDPR